MSFETEFDARTQLPFDEPRGEGRRGGRRGGGRRGATAPIAGFIDGFDPFGPYPGHNKTGRRGHGPGRGRRGDVRNAILALLAEAPHNGYQIIGQIAERTDGLWRPSAGSVYPALGLLEDEGLAEPTEANGHKAFQLTDAGRDYVAANAEQLTEPWARVARPHEHYLDVRKEVGALAMALQQVVLAGDAAQIKAARGILDEARRGIYRVLAGDVPATDTTAADDEPKA